MKVETKQERLNRLLGISEKVQELATRSTGKIFGITEDEIQEFREVQGLYYFLQAPALFTPKVCKHCGEPFLVSRKYVAFCSYTCIQKSLAEQGIQWRKGQDLEALAQDPQVYQGNEPLWIRRSKLLKIREMVLSMDLDSPENQDTESASSVPSKPNPNPVNSSSSNTPENPPQDKPSTTSSSTDSTTTVTQLTGPSSSTVKKPKPKITFDV